MAGNHTNYQARLDFIQEKLKQIFNLEDPVTVDPIDYQESFPFKYNNFTYRITLPSPSTPSTYASPSQPGCSPIPPNTTTFLIRLTNSSAADMHALTRVENEVAMILLANLALASFTPAIVPRVYAWGSAAKSAQGWILQQFMPGKRLNEEFENVDLSREVVYQIAGIVKAFQDFEVPALIEGFGGVTFDARGAVVSAGMSTVGEGPWGTFEESYKRRLEIAVGQADENEYIRGWEENGVRERLDRFIERGLGGMFEGLDGRDEKKIVHGDLTRYNLLYDSETQRITAVLDYDFSCIMHPSYEFLCSFEAVGGRLQGWYEDEPFDERSHLRAAKLYGFPDSAWSTQDQPFWDAARLWEDSLEELDVRRPRTIQGMDKVADVDAVLRGVLPFMLSNEDMLKLRPVEVIVKDRKTYEDELSDLLKHLGF